MGRTIVSAGAGCNYNSETDQEIVINIRACLASKFAQTSKMSADSW